MGEKKEYRSAVRSRRLIREAFLELLRRKPYEKITVTDIVTLADINRSTFYAHYPDVRGLVEELVKDVLDRSDALAREMDIAAFLADPMPFLTTLIGFGQENAEIYALLCRSDFAMGQMEQLKLTLMKRAQTSVDIPERIRTNSAFQIQMGFFIGGIMNIYVLWLQGNLQCTIAEITEQIALLIKNNADVYLNW